MSDSTGGFAIPQEQVIDFLIYEKYYKIKRQGIIDHFYIPTKSVKAYNNDMRRVEELRDNKDTEKIREWEIQLKEED